MLALNTNLQKRYRVLRELGHGGMGTVYEALDQRVSCIVALKETTAGNNDDARRAFHREASLLGNLRHSALPKVMDYFTEGDGDFLVMEFIPGYDLAELLELRESAFPAAQVMRWADKLLEVLEYLHGQKPPILHRDIKPSNLKLTKEGEIFLLDFGLAKGAAGQMPTVMTSRSVRGYTPVYSPLEQIHGQGTDPRSDLYSLSATLYHLLTGVTPSDAPTRFNTIEDDLPDPLLPIESLNSQCPSGVAAVIRQGMAINRRQRPIGAAEMRKALRQAADEDERGAAEEEYRRAEIKRQQREVERRKAEDEATRIAEKERQRLELEAHRLQEETRQREVERRKAAEAAAHRVEEERQREELEAHRREEEARQREAERRQADAAAAKLKAEEEAAHRAAEEERQRQELEVRRREEEARQREAERLKADAAAAKLKAEEEAAHRVAEAERQLQELEVRRRQEEARQREAERRKAEESAQRKAAAEVARVAHEERRRKDMETQPLVKGPALQKVKSPPNEAGKPVREERHRLEVATKSEGPRTEITAPSHELVESRAVKARRPDEEKRGTTNQRGAGGMHQDEAGGIVTRRDHPAMTQGLRPALMPSVESGPVAVEGLLDPLYRKPPESARRTLLVIIATPLALVLIAAVAWVWHTGNRNSSSVVPQPPSPPIGMVLVPGGTFTMGRADGVESEYPIHKVTVKPFYIALNEVTNQDYQKFVQAAGQRPPATWVNGSYSSDAARQPVTGISWDDANAYAKWTNGRLPTEEEWEFAARDGDGRLYPWGNDWQQDAANANGARRGMADVGSFKGKSPFGAVDLIGNAWEWTASDLRAYPGGSLPSDLPSGDLKVIRGGSFESTNGFATATYRAGWPARGARTYAATGFRCAADVPR